MEQSCFAGLSRTRLGRLWAHLSCTSSQGSSRKPHAGLHQSLTQLVMVEAQYC